MKHTTIKKQSRLLVEHILNNDPLSANKVFSSLINEVQLIREAEAADEAGVAEEPVELELTADAESETDMNGDETAEIETSEEINTEPVEDVTEQNPDEVDEMLDDVIEINCQINAKMISNLFDKIAELKNKIETLGLDPKSRDYITYETTIEYYSNKLQDLQEKTNPGIDQEKVSTAIQKIESGLSELFEVTGSNSEEDAIDEIASPDEVAADNGLIDAEETADVETLDDEGSAEAGAETEATVENDAANTEETLDNTEEKVSDEEEIEELFS